MASPIATDGGTHSPEHEAEDFWPVSLAHAAIVEDHHPMPGGPPLKLRSTPFDLGAVVALDQDKRRARSTEYFVVDRNIEEMCKGHDAPPYLVRWPEDAILVGPNGCELSGPSRAVPSAAMVHFSMLLRGLPFTFGRALSPFPFHHVGLLLLWRATARL